MKNAMSMKKTMAGAVVAAALAVGALFGIQTEPPKDPFFELESTRRIEFQSTPKTWDTWGPAQSMDERMEVTRERLANHRGEGYRLRRAAEGQEWSRIRTLGDTMQVLQDRLRDAAVGAVWLARAVDDGFTVKSRKVDTNPAIGYPTVGTTPIDIVVGTLKTRHPGISIGGIYSCRPILGSSTLSQHSYANAVDVFGSSEAMNAAAYDLYRMAKAGLIPVSQVLWNNKNLFTGNYVYDHTNHIHFSGDPLLSGGCSQP